MSDNDKDQGGAPPSHAKLSKEEARQKAETEAQKARERFEKQRKEMEAKIQAAQAAQLERKATPKPKPKSEKSEDAKKVDDAQKADAKKPHDKKPDDKKLDDNKPERAQEDTRGVKRSHQDLAADDMLYSTGDKRQDSKQAKRVVAQRSEEMMASMGFAGFGKKGGKQHAAYSSFSYQ
uniref:Uncharacterized protein n=1 Tax=Eutreptiella gymnastica TaxID=73025 RepID=A0A7S4C9L1_9EUGL|eukprot:CAMPEP_0174286606 /NCGR_PEP_ID=MMETSP0809-20121228/12710_1 /TAXON_ID=73025 ORGANISM="Eutreptiella gymnastica-like, Strain CCMP1594" /NCGR_SAMPLE_ID=MMETSP0809 /ASSEMBLY_ACC=CAM_ASM_000658 /LENGTH=177 /DNA_ID=CAMNT_0015382759 /DNA_START=24 /DNA_END=557 /DNA_ORIENTATION=-